MDGRAVLRQVAELPISTWNYMAEDESVRHIGPTAQDFAAAFGVGNGNRHIGTVDSDGVALAAIQGLNQLVEEKEGRIVALEQEVETLEARLVALERAAGGSPVPSERGLAVWAPLLVGLGLVTLWRRGGRGGQP